MPGDHGRHRNVAERWGEDDQAYHPPVGQDNRVKQDGWKQMEVELPPVLVLFEGTGGLHSTADLKEKI